MFWLQANVHTHKCSYLLSSLIQRTCIPLVLGLKLLLQCLLVETKPVERLLLVEGTARHRKYVEKSGFEHQYLFVPNENTEALLDEC